MIKESSRFLYQNNLQEKFFIFINKFIFCFENSSMGCTKWEISEKLSPFSFFRPVTNDILSMILSIFELETKLVSKIKAYQSKDLLQNEKGLEKYIDKILTEKAEKK